MSCRFRPLYRCLLAIMIAISSPQTYSKEKTTSTIDNAGLQQEPVVFQRKESRNVSLKDTRFEEALAKNWPVQKMMTVDMEGYQVLGGCGDDPNRYQLQGEIAGTVVRIDTNDIIATYNFRVVKIVAGRTERLTDAYLVCKGTYWLPVPVPKPDLRWENVPPTLVTYEVSKSGGVVLMAENVIPKIMLKENGQEKIEKDLDTCFVLTAEFEPAIFGKDSVHLPASLSKNANQTQSKRDIAKRIVDEAALHTEIASNKTVEEIEVSIAISIKPSHLPCPISDRLQSLIKKYDVETVLGFTKAGTTFVNMGNGVVIKLKEEWGMPFSFKTDKVPVVKFKNGIIGIVDKEIYVKEGTQAMVGEKTYTYMSQKWLGDGQRKLPATDGLPVILSAVKVRPLSEIGIRGKGIEERKACLVLR